jgi:hypothetical protein
VLDYKHKSNKKLIRNAICNVCLAGKVCEAERVSTTPLYLLLCL